MVIQDLFSAPPDPESYSPDLSQYMTPSWAAQAIVEHALPHFQDGAVIIEPSCGIGRFLDCLPQNTRNIGVEIDPRLADIARSKGHEVITGDFRSVELPIDAADALIGNPPFVLSAYDSFMRRAHSLLDVGGQVIMLLPTYIFQTAHNVVRWNAQWSIQQEMLPRNIFPGLRLPLMLARFTKDPRPKLTGMILYHEAAAIADMPRIYRQALEEGRSGWAAVVEVAIQNLGGRAELKAIYSEVEPRRPTANKFWKEKIRQTLQQRFTRTGEGQWTMAA